jgi:hypothetical protein
MVVTQHKIVYIADIIHCIIHTNQSSFHINNYKRLINLELIINVTAYRHS